MHLYCNMLNMPRYRGEVERMRFQVRHKYTGEVLEELPIANQSDVDAAVGSARRAAKRPLSPYGRYEVLRNTAELLLKRKEQFALTICREAGKPIQQARGEVDRAYQTLVASAEEAKRIAGEMVPLEGAPAGKGRIGFTLRRPVGVVCAITPFNFPLNLVAHKVGPGLAAGNAMLLKPSNLAPLTAILLFETLREAGLPEGYLNLLHGPGKEVGERLLGHPGIDMYTFTGSAGVGRRIKEAAGLRKVALELGNNSANVVCADAPLEQAAKSLASMAYAYAGQTCISVQRIYVERTVYDAFLERFEREVQALAVGDPEDESVHVGPMISEDEAKRAQAWVREAVAEGATLHLGGERQGAVLAPTLLTNVKPEMRVVCDEVFAPVVSVQPFDSLEEAIEGVNASRYGLQAGVFTRDATAAFRFARELEVGGVIINDTSSFRVDLMPYGGVKESGLGREGPRYAIEEMTEPVLVVWNLSEG